MISLRRDWFAAFLFFPFVLGLLAGCNNTPLPLKKDTDDNKPTDDPFQEAREVVRMATEPAAYQKALEIINGQLNAQPNVLNSFQVGPKDKPDLLKALGKL